MNPVLDDVDNVSALQSTSIENGVRDVAVNTGGRFGTIWELLKWFKKKYDARYSVEISRVL